MADRLTGTHAAAAPAQPRARRLLWGLLVVFVVAVHGCVGREVANGMAVATAASEAPRIEVDFVRPMEVAAAPAPAARAAAPAEAVTAAAPARVRKRPRPPARKASAPEPVPDVAAVEAGAASDPVLAQASAASEVDGGASAAESSASGVSSATATASAGESGSASAGAATAESADATAGRAPAVVAAAADPASSPASGSPLAAFDWPVSTRVSFLLTGYYRGDVNGSAKVEWIRIGTHYQVHLDMVVGPSFAPVISRRMTSDGEITAAGLAPHRYDQQTRVMGMDRAPATLTFEPGSVVLANGNRVADLPGLQDTASQFVQLSYVFGTRPELLRVGGSIDIPLALPHKVDVWTYDVAAEETLQTPFGPLASVHLTPRRKSDRSDELTAEIWFAPQLRYLPVRIRIRQGAESYLDLMIDRRPDLAGSRNHPAGHENIP